MLNGIFSTLPGKFVNEKKLEMITNNMANVSTPGYKASRPVFTVATDEETSGDPGLRQTFVSIQDSYLNFSNAPLIESGNVFDCAIEGDGFFVVSTKDGNMYTRNGQFSLDTEKRLVTSDGNPVLGKNGVININGKEVMIESDGSVFVDGVLADTLKVVNFADKRDLRNYGKGLFINTNDRDIPADAEKSSIKQGFYETSNVDIMKEMVEMISTLRAYESYTKVDQSFNDTLGKLFEIGRP